MVVHSQVCDFLGSKLQSDLPGFSCHARRLYWLAYFDVSYDSRSLTSVGCRPWVFKLVHLPSYICICPSFIDHILHDPVNSKEKDKLFTRGIDC